jgi:5'-phosphate synthase pdxT subunit
MNSRTPVVGLLALQGDYQKHRQVLDRIGVKSVAVRTAVDFDGIDRLIIPGGESTVIRELLTRLGLEERFTEFIKARPVWGTCAGMILLSSRVNDDPLVPYGAINIAVDRNGYGRQIYSTAASAVLEMNDHREEFDLILIRAPRVTSFGQEVKILLKWNDDPVLLCHRNVLVSSFHPELTGSTFLHEYFSYRFGKQVVQSEYQYND